jgi:hypothetical protein
MVSGERIWTEVKKTLAGNYAGQLALTMLEVGVGRMTVILFTTYNSRLIRIFRENSTLFRAVLWIRIRIGSSPHHFPGSGSVSVPTKCRYFYFIPENYDIYACDEKGKTM